MKTDWRTCALSIGASMGGLLAARALADLFGDGHRAGARCVSARRCSAQGRAAGASRHGLLARGRDRDRRILSRAGPTRSSPSGGCRGDIANDVYWIGHGVTLKTAPSDMIGLLASPSRCWKAMCGAGCWQLPNVRAIERCAVHGLVADERAIRDHAASAFTGRQRRRTEVSIADLVVDASGRGSVSPAWLEGFGYRRPDGRKIEIGIGYTTRIYRRRRTDLGGKLGDRSCRQRRRTGATAPIRSRAKIAGSSASAAIFGDDAPDERPDVSRPMRDSLPTPRSTTSSPRAEPLTDFIRYRYAANLRRRYERLARFPKGYLVFGDAIVQLQPGLRPGHDGGGPGGRHCCKTCLRDDGAESGARASSRQQRRSRSIPLGYRRRQRSAAPASAGSRVRRKVRFINWYIGKLHMAAQHDAALGNAFLQVANMQASPTRLLHPVVVMQVIRGNLSRRLRRSREATQAGAQA